MIVHKTRAVTRAAFTLMEVLVVVAILVILAGLVSVVAFRYLDDANDQAAQAGIVKIETAVGAYKLSHQGQYPADLNALIQPEEDGKAAYLAEREIYDPWLRPYQYEPNNLHPATRKPRVYSLGANPGVSTPIANW